MTSGSGSRVGMEAYIGFGDQRRRWSDPSLIRPVANPSSSTLKDHHKSHYILEGGKREGRDGESVTEIRCGWMWIHDFQNPMVFGLLVCLVQEQVRGFVTLSILKGMCGNWMSLMK